MEKIVGFLVGAAASLVAAAWLYGGSTWGPGFTAKDDIAKFNPNSEPVAAVSERPQPDVPDASARDDRAGVTSGNAAPQFNTGGNPAAPPGSSPNWGLGFGLSGTSSTANPPDPRPATKAK